LEQKSDRATTVVNLYVPYCVLSLDPCRKKICYLPGKIFCCLVLFMLYSLSPAYVLF